MKKLLFFFLVLSFAAQAQVTRSHRYDWARVMGSNATVHATAVATDIGGFTYVTGWFSGTTNFVPGSTTGFTYTAVGPSDIFIAKLDPGGAPMWVKRIGGPLDDQGMGIAVDMMGNIVVTGIFSMTVDFDPDLPAYPVTSNGASDDFLLKLDMDGRFRWVKHIGSMAPDRTLAVTMNETMTNWYTGVYLFGMDLNPDPFAATNVTWMSETDIFLCHHDMDGNFLWGKAIKGYKADTAFSLAYDSKETVYAAGTFNGILNMDPNTLGKVEVGTNGLCDIFMTSLNRFGIYYKSYAVGGIGNDQARSVAVDKNGNIYIAGYFQDTVDFDPVDTVTVKMGAKGTTDAFLVCLDTGAHLKWVRTFGGDGQYCAGMNVGVDLSSNVYLSGNFSGTIDADPDTSSLWLTSNGNTDVFITKLDTGGKTIWAKSFGGAYNDSTTAMSMHVSGAIHTVGACRDSFDFDPGLKVDRKGGSATYQNMFVQRLVPCTAVFDTVKTSVCDSFVLAGTKYTKTGVYNQLVEEPGNCDKFVHLDLKISPKLNDTVTLTGTMFTSKATGCTYQWISCKDGGKILPGATAKSYIAIGDGDYAVIIDNGICRDTTACMTITGVPAYNAIAEQSVETRLNIFPNPAKGVFTIEAGDLLMGAQVRITNLLGQTVKTFSITEKSSMHELPRGFYVIAVEKGELKNTTKLMVE